MFDKILKPEFDPVSHTFKLGGYDLTGVTRLISSYEEEFDAKSISFFMARNDLRKSMGWKTGDPDPTDTAIAARQAEILAEWDSKRDEAAEHGNKVHSMFQKFLTTGEVVFPKTQSFLEKMKNDTEQIYKETGCELLMCNPESGVAGILDMAGVRNCKDLIIDIDDFKTNLFKGITFDSISRKEGKVKHYNRFFKPPLAHLEQCNYNKYALQLSSYGYMLEKQLGARIGRLRIFWVDFDPQLEMIDSCGFIPVPYMRHEVIQMFKDNAVKITTADW